MCYAAAGVETQVVMDSQTAEDPAALRNHAHSLRDHVMCRLGGDIDSVQDDSAGRGPHDSGDGTQSCRLAPAIRTQNRDDAAELHAKVYPGQNICLSVSGRYIPPLQLPRRWIGIA